jgi:hypothetical protein
MTRSILEPTSTLVDVVSPSGQTISVSVEGIPHSVTYNAISPLAREADDPAVSAPDFGQTPLTITDSAASTSMSLEVLEIIKLLGQLQEQFPGPVHTTTSGGPEEVSCSTSF